MQNLFGIPMDTLALILSAAFGVAVAVVAVLAARNRVFLRLGLRNVGRRRSRALLIVIGLMLGTALISAALNTGDTLAHTVRSSALTSLGKTDELVTVKGVQAGTNALAAGAVVDYFDESKVEDVRRATAGSNLVAGVAPAISEVIALQDTTSRRTESQVGLFASDPASTGALDRMTRTEGGDASLADLSSDELYLNAKAADKLDAHAGDEVLVYAGAAVLNMRVKGIVNYKGTGTAESAALMPLPSAQRLVGKPRMINYILVANRGGVGETGAVISALEAPVDAAGLQIRPTKRDLLETADEIGNGMMLVFTTFGTFSIVAGILLIFLIFVMLSAERKAEMGISRAVGTQRGNLVQMFLFEGVAYDVVAAAIGAVLGVGIAYVMVLVMAMALANFGFHLEHDMRVQSLIIAYTLGVLLTLAVVTVSAWQVSVLNIVRAVRNLPDPVTRSTGRRGWVLVALAWSMGALLILAGFASKQAVAFHLGVSLVIMGFIPLLRLASLSERLAYTLPALALTAWWLMPFFVTESFLPGMSKDFTIFVLSGLMVVLGATWVIMFNSDLILGGTMALFGRVRWLAPMLKAAVAYPLSSRFRTGMTMAMFTLVVFTIVVMSTVVSSVNGVIDDETAFGGGYDVQAITAPIAPIDDLPQAMSEAGMDPSLVQASAAASIIPMRVRQVGARSGEFQDYVIRGVDDSFLRDNSYDLALRATGYDSPRAVWQALADNPDLAVIDSTLVPRRTNYSTMGGDTFKLSGFYLEDGTLPLTKIDVRDDQTGLVRTVTVIGVLRDTGSILNFGITTSQRSAVAAYGDRARPVVHLIKLSPSVDASAAADAFESAFLRNGMQAKATKDQLADVMTSQHAFTYILQGFLGLGLIVGVAALGVISARAVVERRQEIGVLRSLGFQRGMVSVAFLLESSFISLLGILLGTVLGLIVAFNVVLDYRSTPGWESMAYTVPWMTLLVVFVVVYAGSVFATLLPAQQASSVYPAQALRYE